MIVDDITCDIDNRDIEREMYIQDLEEEAQEEQDIADESEEQDMFLGDVINYDELEDDSMEESYMPDKVRKLGSAEYDANEGRHQRISMYRQLANLEEGFEVAEDNIDEWALGRTASYYNRPRRRVKAEILGQKWSDLEE